MRDIVELTYTFQAGCEWHQLGSRAPSRMVPQYQVGREAKVAFLIKYYMIVMFNIICAVEANSIWSEALG